MVCQMPTLDTYTIFGFYYIFINKSFENIPEGVLFYTLSTPFLTPL